MRGNSAMLAGLITKFWLGPEEAFTEATMVRCPSRPWELCPAGDRDGAVGPKASVSTPVSELSPDVSFGGKVQPQPVRSPRPRSRGASRAAPRNPRRARQQGDGSRTTQGSVRAGLRRQVARPTDKRTNASEHVAIQCVHPNRRYIRLRKHATHQLVARADTQSISFENAWDMVPTSDAAAVRFRSAMTGDFLTMNPRAGGLLSADPGTAKNEVDYWFRIERTNKTVRIFSPRANSYVNCVHTGALRGQEPSKNALGTAFEIIKIGAGDLQETKPSDEVEEETEKKGVTRNSPVTVDCERACRGDAALLEGYPLTTHPHFNFICPSTYRDLADWVFAWPFKHFNEHPWVAPKPLAARCMANMPVIYTHSNALNLIQTFARKMLKRPFVLISGQSDFPVSRSKSLLSEPLLVRWYAQNGDVNHPKLRRLPIGLNCFEHGSSMLRALNTMATPQRKASLSVKDHTSLLWVNFGYTHPQRKIAWSHFCASGMWKGKATCVVKTQKSAGLAGTSLVEHYQRVSRHRFVATPRGNGLGALTPYFATPIFPPQILTDFGKPYILVAYPSFKRPL